MGLIIENGLRERPLFVPFLCCDVIVTLAITSIFGCSASPVKPATSPATSQSEAAVEDPASDQTADEASGQAPEGAGEKIIPVAARRGAANNPLQPERAMGYLNSLCDLGPRPTGSKAMLAQQELISKHFEQLGGKVEWQRFRFRHPLQGTAVDAANLIVHWHPDAKERILLCAHYDTRPQPDNENVPAQERGHIFVGANDGASGTALLMELAHFMPEVSGRYGVDFLLVDAEEFVFPGSTRKDRYFIGSEYFSRDYVASRNPYTYRKGAVLDMIGDRSLQIYQDRNSVWWRDTRPVTREIWSVADKLNIKEFIPKLHPHMKQPIRDDHIMLHNIGKIPTCEIIDFDYPKYPINRYWHTDEDTPQKCSGESLAKVGWVMLEWLKTAE